MDVCRVCLEHKAITNGVPMCLHEKTLENSIKLIVYGGAVPHPHSYALYADKRNGQPY